jgi:hypothetical protein
MSTRKILLFAGMAFAMAAFALPATASAFTIKDNGKTLEKATLPMTGAVRVESLGSGFECGVDSALSVNVDTVEVTEFKLTTATCVTFGSAFKNCSIESDEATLPWSVILEKEGLEIPSAVFDVNLKNCFTTKFTGTFNNLRFKQVNWKFDTIRPYVGWEFGFEPKFDTDSGAITFAVKGHLQFGGDPEVETYEIV